MPRSFDQSGGGGRGDLGGDFGQFSGFLRRDRAGETKRGVKIDGNVKDLGFFWVVFWVFTGEDVGGVEGGEFRLFLAAPAKAAAPGQGRGAWKRQK